MNDTKKSENIGTNLNNNKDFDHNDMPEDLKANTHTTDSNSKNKNNTKNDEQIKDILMKELNDNLNIDFKTPKPQNETTDGQNDDNKKNPSIISSLSVIPESNGNDEMSIKQSCNFDNQAKDIPSIKSSAIENYKYDEDNEDLMSVYGGNNDLELIVKNLENNEIMKQDFSIIEEDYLKVIEFGKVTQEQINKIIKPIKKNDLLYAKNIMERVELDGKIISRISDIKFLLIKDKSISNDAMSELEQKLLEKNIYGWREIFPGGDSFFRAIIFSYIEDIILTRNLSQYCVFLYELNKNIDDKYFNRILSFYKIEYSRALTNLILIYYALKVKKVDDGILKAHSIFIKTFNFDINFDMLIILNLKYIIYKYLRDNERKLYTKDYSVQMGSLLPAKYITQRGYIFKTFYENNLLQLNKEADKISISVIPFILRRDLYIYSFENNKVNQFVVNTGNNENKDFVPFKIILTNGSYQIIYTNDYYIQYQKFFSLFSSIANIYKVNSQSQNVAENKIKESNIFNTKNTMVFAANTMTQNVNMNMKSQSNNHFSPTPNNNKKCENQRNLNFNTNINNINDNIDNEDKRPKTEIFGKLRNRKKNNSTSNNNQNINNNNFKSTAQISVYGVDNKDEKERNSNSNNINNQYQQKFSSQNSAFQRPQFNNNKINTQIINECARCKKPIKIDQFYCDACNLDFIVNYIQKNYIIFIKNNISNLIKGKNVENLSLFLANLKINYSNSYQKTFTESYNNLTEYDRKEFTERFSSIRTSICLGCFKYIGGNQINKNNNICFRFPCGCIFCSGDCLNRFINAVSFMKFNYFSCACGKEYDYVNLKYLLYFSMSLNLFKFKNEILRFLYEIIKNKCCKCKREIELKQDNNNSLNIIQVSDPEVAQIFNINHFNHLICDKCYKNNEKIKNEFYCVLCNANHKVINNFTINKCAIRNTCSIF